MGYPKYRAWSNRFKVMVYSGDTVEVIFGNQIFDYLIELGEVESFGRRELDKFSKIEVNSSGINFTYFDISDCGKTQFDVILRIKKQICLDQLCYYVYGEQELYQNDIVELRCVLKWQSGLFSILIFQATPQVYLCPFYSTRFQIPS